MLIITRLIAVSSHNTARKSEEERERKGGRREYYIGIDEDDACDINIRSDYHSIDILQIASGPEQQDPGNSKHDTQR